MAFSSAASWLELFAQATDRTVGATLSPDDPSGALLSAQVGIKNAAQSVWDAPSPALGWDSATWDDDNFATWVDVSDRVRALDWDRGSTDPISSSPEVGTAAVTLENLDGELSPWATTGPFTNPVDSTPLWDVGKWDAETPGANASMIRPNTPVRFGATFSDGSWLPFFTGLIESIEEGSDDQNVDAWVTITIADICSALAGITDAASGAGLIAGDDAASMFFALLDDVSFAYDAEVVDTGAAIDPTTVPMQIPDPTINRLQAAQRIAASVFAYVIGTSDGRVAMVSFSSGVASALPTFSNDPTNTEFPALGFVPYSSIDRLLNQASGTRVGGITQSTRSPDSVAAYGPQANALGWPRDDLLNASDGDVLAVLVAVVAAQATDFLGISEIDVDADLQPSGLFAALCLIASEGLEAPTGIAARWVHPSATAFSTNVLLAGFHHTITMEGTQAKWTASLRTTRA